MNTEQLIWFIDSRFYYQTTSLDKLVQLISAHQKTLRIIIDASAQLKGRGYWHLLQDKATLPDETMEKISLKQQQLLNFFKMNAINVDITVNKSSDYLTVLKTCFSEKTKNMVIIEDQLIQKRHSIFQKLTEIPAPILLLNNKPWVQPMSIVAAVDPLHEYARGGRIDQRISAFVTTYADILKANWKLAHCYQVSSLSSIYKNKILSIHKDGVIRFAKAERIEPSKCLLLEGEPEVALTRYIKHNNVQLLIMGLVARNKLEQFWIGSTTTALLADIPCDILLIKG